MKDDLKEFAPTLARWGVALVFLWFGVNQILFQDNFIGYLPTWIYSLNVDPFLLLYANGIFEIIFGLLLVVGIGTRVSALLLALHLAGIALSLGYNDIAVRDLGLSIVTLSVFLRGPDNWCMDKNWKKESKLMRLILLFD